VISAVLICTALGNDAVTAQVLGTRLFGKHAALLRDVQTLVAKGIPLGIVLGQGDTLDMEVLEKTTQTSRSLPSPTRELLLAGFGQQWGELFRITDASQSVNAVSVRSAVCSASLERDVKGASLQGTPVELLFSIVLEIDPTLQQLPPPGIVSGGGEPGALDPDAQALRTPLSVVIPKGSLKGALNQLVSTAHNIGWFAGERCDAMNRCGCYLGLITPTSVLYTSYDAAVSRY
jgi:hypothetical protein